MWTPTGAGVPVSRPREDVDLHPEDAEAHIAGYTILCGCWPGTCRCARCASSSALSRARIPRRRWAWPWGHDTPSVLFRQALDEQPVPGLEGLAEQDRGGVVPPG